MVVAQPEQARFSFHSQLPRGDGCGVYVLQMLTGLAYDELASLIDWGGRSVHHTTWSDLCGVLATLGWSIGEPVKTNLWSDIMGAAIVHVQGDHFILYDAEHALFYDPGKLAGPAASTELTPVSYLRVERDRGSHDERVELGRLPGEA